MCILILLLHISNMLTRLLAIRNEIIYGHKSNNRYVKFWKALLPTPFDLWGINWNCEGVPDNSSRLRGAINVLGYLLFWNVLTLCDALVHPYAATSKFVFDTFDTCWHATLRNSCFVWHENCLCPIACGPLSITYSLRRWTVACCLLQIAHSLWHWPLASGLRPMVHGLLPMANGIRHVA